MRKKLLSRNMQIICPTYTHTHTLRKSVKLQFCNRSVCQLSWLHSVMQPQCGVSQQKLDCVTDWPRNFLPYRISSQTNHVSRWARGKIINLGTDVIRPAFTEVTLSLSKLLHNSLLPILLKGKTCLSR